MQRRITFKYSGSELIYMLEEETRPCPRCETVLPVKILRVAKVKKETFLVDEDCFKCKLPASRIGNFYTAKKKPHIQTSKKGYFKLDPRG